MIDHGLKCPKCGEEAVWDRAYGNCWRCDYRAEPAPLAWIVPYLKIIWGR
jgi:hypothetical protein